MGKVDFTQSRALAFSHNAWLVSRSTFVHIPFVFPVFFLYKEFSNDSFPTLCAWRNLGPRIFSAGRAFPFPAIDRGLRREGSSLLDMAPSRKTSAKDSNKKVQKDTANSEDVDPKIKPEQASSQPGPPATASTNAQSKGLMGPPLVKPSRISAPGPQIVPDTQLEDEGVENSHDQLYASQPSTPDEQSSIEPEPGNPLEAFDWYELQAKYHDMIKERDAVEQQLLQDFEHLSQVGLSSTNPVLTHC